MRDLREAGKGFMLAIILSGLLFFVVNVIVVPIFNVTGTGLLVANAFPTIFLVIAMIWAFNQF